MARTILITGELRSWYSFGNPPLLTYVGKMYHDMHGIFEDGAHHSITPSMVKSISEYGDYYLLRTQGWNLKLMKSERIK